MKRRLGSLFRRLSSAPAPSPGVFKSPPDYASSDSDDEYYFDEEDYLSFFDILPDELIIEIFKFVNVEDLCRHICLVNLRFSRLYRLSVHTLSISGALRKLDEDALIKVIRTFEKLEKLVVCNSGSLEDYQITNSGLIQLAHKYIYHNADFVLTPLTFHGPSPGFSWDNPFVGPTIGTGFGSLFRKKDFGYEDMLDSLSDTLEEDENDSHYSYASTLTGGGALSILSFRSHDSDDVRRWKQELRRQRGSQLEDDSSLLTTEAESYSSSSDDDDDEEEGELPRRRRKERRTLDEDETDPDPETEIETEPSLRRCGSVDELTSLFFERQRYRRLHPDPSPDPSPSPAPVPSFPLPPSSPSPPPPPLSTRSSYDRRRASVALRPTPSSRFRDFESIREGKGVRHRSRRRRRRRRRKRITQRVSHDIDDDDDDIGDDYETLSQTSSIASSPSLVLGGGRQHPLLRARILSFESLRDQDHESDEDSDDDDDSDSDDRFSHLSIMEDDLFDEDELLALSHQDDFNDRRNLGDDSEKTEPIYGLPTLKYVDLTGCYLLTDFGIKYLTYICRGIEHLCLRGCTKLTDTAVEYFSEFSNLKELDLGGLTRLSDRSMECIAEHLELVQLDVTFCRRITDEGCLSISSMTSLVDVNLQCCIHITPTGLAHLLRNLKQIQRLNLTGCSYIELGPLAAFEEDDFEVPHLQVLNLLGCVHVGDDCMDVMIQRMRCRKLRSLTLAYSDRITDNGIRAIVMYLRRSLQKLNLKKCPQITIDSIHSVVEFASRSILSLSLDGLRLPSEAYVLLQQLPLIEQLSLSRCTTLDDDSLRHLARLVWLKYLCVTGCRNVTYQGVHWLCSRHHRYWASRRRRGKGGLFGWILNKTRRKKFVGRKQTIVMKRCPLSLRQFRQLQVAFPRITFVY